MEAAMPKCLYMIFDIKWKEKDEFIKWKRCQQIGRPDYCSEHTYAACLLALARSAGCPRLDITLRPIRGREPVLLTVERGLESWTQACNRMPPPSKYIGLVKERQAFFEPRYEAIERALKAYQREYFPDRDAILWMYGDQKKVG